MEPNACSILAVLVLLLTRSDTSHLRDAIEDIKDVISVIKMGVEVADQALDFFSGFAKDSGAGKVAVLWSSG